MIAVHFRKIAGASRLLVASMNDAIQESNRRRPLPLVFADVVFESVGVSLRIPVTFVPPCLAVVWDAEDSAVLERDLLDKIRH